MASSPFGRNVAVVDRIGTLNLSREKIFSNLADTSKELIIKLYGSVEEYVDAGEISPLEDYIISFDENMDHAGIIQGIGERIGISVDIMEDFDTSTTFYNVLVDVINKKGRDPKLNDIVNYTKLEFDGYLLEIGKSDYQGNDNLYFDRLYAYANDFEEKIMREY